jgi:hypothetical protein
LVPVRNGQSEVESPFLLRYSHHLTGTRPLIQRAPLCDILPEGYLASKSRTRNRVRFAGERHQQAEFADVSNIEVSSSGSSTSDASESGDEKAPVDGKDGIEMDDLITKTRRSNETTQRSAIFAIINHGFPYLRDRSSTQSEN